MGEPGWKIPPEGVEDCYAIRCPINYCGANPGSHCMNKQGRFTKHAHQVRRDTFASGPNKIGPGNWNRRPTKNVSMEEKFKKYYPDS